MKMKSIRLMAFAAVLMPLLYSCSGGAGSSDTPLFGPIPGLYEQFQAEKDKITKEAENIKTEAEKAALIEKSTKMTEQWGVKLEEGAKSLNGKPVEFEVSNLMVNEPISLEFEGLKGKSDLLPTFKVNGRAVADADIDTGFDYVLPSEMVYIVGYDAEGQLVYKVKAGSIPAQNVDKKSVVKAGTAVTLSKVQFSSKNVEEYKAAKTLKLEIHRR